MAKLKFDLPAPSDSATTYEKIKKHLSGENVFKKYDSKVVCSFDEASKKCRVKGSQFDAELSVHKKSDKESLVAIEVEVSMALTLFKGQIKEMIEKTLKKII